MSFGRNVRFLILLSFVASCGEDAPTGGDTSITAEVVRTEQARFVTSDGYTIFGTWYTPGRPTGPRPVVLLLHWFSGNHTQWFSLIPDFIPELVRSGYVVLAIDLRGHGQSTDKNGEYAPFGLFTADEVHRMMEDVPSAIAWIKTRPDADSQRIAVIGVELGANLAFFSSNTYPEIKTAVSISPQFREGQPSLGPEYLRGLSDFQPNSVLFLAAFGDGYAFTSAETMAQATDEPVRVTGYQGSAHGFFLLRETATRQEILSWLTANL